jgi:putative transposase
MSDGHLLEPRRRTPAQGVHLKLDRPNWVFLTVCTEKRSPWLAQSGAQRVLHQVWKEQATAWLVSDYVPMPDHLHLFCASRDVKFTIERWIAFWKDRFAKAHLEQGRFQSGGFHHRLRDDESYSEKWRYAWENPVRKGLVSRAQDWPFWGKVHEIHW